MIKIQSPWEISESQKVQLEHNHAELEWRIIANGRSLCLLEPVATSN